MAEVASVGVAVVPVGHRGSNVGNGGVEGQLVRHEGAIVGIGGGHAGVVVGKGVSLGISLRKCSVMIIDKSDQGISSHLSLGLPLLAPQVDERSDLVNSSMGQGNRVDSSSHRGNSVVDQRSRSMVDDGGDVMEDRVGDNLVAHLEQCVSDIFNEAFRSDLIPQLAPQRQT